MISVPSLCCSFYRFLKHQIKSMCNITLQPATVQFQWTKQLAIVLGIKSIMWNPNFSALWAHIHGTEKAKKTSKTTSGNDPNRPNCPNCPGTKGPSVQHLLRAQAGPKTGDQRYELLISTWWWDFSQKKWENWDRIRWVPNIFTGSHVFLIELVKYQRWIT